MAPCEGLVWETEGGVVEDHFCCKGLWCWEVCAGFWCLIGFFGGYSVLSFYPNTVSDRDGILCMVL